ncbi:MAG: 30S ribosomal protein S14 [Holosporales bacterium]|jgi:small subunit ribosomal protein S14|nr:30S ribosomal protein S14 [Holosporales bacterium]
MAKISAIENNNRRKKLVADKMAARLSLRAIIKNKDTAFDDRLSAVHRLAEKPRNSSGTRVRNRCSITGRPRGYYRKFGISRIALRELASAGFLPGVIKASW